MSWKSNTGVAQCIFDPRQACRRLHGVTFACSVPHYFHSGSMAVLAVADNARVQHRGNGCTVTAMVIAVDGEDGLLTWRKKHRVSTHPLLASGHSTMAVITRGCSMDKKGAQAPQWHSRRLRGLHAGTARKASLDEKSEKHLRKRPHAPC